MAEDIKKVLEEYKKHTDKKFAETNRHFDVVAERLEDKIGILSEQVTANTVKLEEHDQRFEQITKKLQEHDQRFDRLDETLNTIKLDIEFIKHDLKQKISRDEFAALEKRVSLLEAKVK